MPCQNFILVPYIIVAKHTIFLDVIVLQELWIYIHFIQLVITWHYMALWSAVTWITARNFIMWNIMVEDKSKSITIILITFLRSW